jgi:adenine/guanine phosphoribosyltransferase-like PRPP-binding protein
MSDDDYNDYSGTIKAVVDLMQMAGCDIEEVCCLIELCSLNGRAQFNCPLFSIVKY